MIKSERRRRLAWTTLGGCKETGQQLRARMVLRIVCVQSLIFFFTQNSHAQAFTHLQSTSYRNYERSMLLRTSSMYTSKSNPQRRRGKIRRPVSRSPVNLHLTPEMTELLSSQFSFDIPFQELATQLSDALDVGAGLSQAVGNIPEIETSIVLKSIGYDLLVFLAASVCITPLAKALNISPILGYLMAGALLGPNGIDMFANK
jgi:hypothetical protein